MASSRVTIRDVARDAGVSPTTVSHVLNGQGRVHADTRQRVERTVLKLGYRANPLARNLRHERFGAIGLYLPEHSLNFKFYVDLAMAASATVFEQGCGLTLLPPVDSPGDLLGLPLDGVIVAEPVVDDPVIAALAASNIPLVLCEAASSPRGPHVRVIDNQHDLATAGLLDHLFEQGAREIAAVVPDPSVWWGRLVRAAIESWQQRVDVPVRWTTIPFACTPGEAREVIDQLLADSTPDALVIAQQGLGSVALAAAAERGLTVPDDLLVACCVDGPDLLATNPSVTAIDLRPRECGQLAARLLLEQSSEHSVPLHPQLRVRASTTRRRRIE